MQGHQVTAKYLEKHGFSYPIMLPEFEGLGLKLPPPSFSVKNVEEYVGKGVSLMFKGCACVCVCVCVCVWFAMLPTFIFAFPQIFNDWMNE